MIEEAGMLLNDLNDAIKGSHIDKKNSRDKVQKILKKINQEGGDRLIISQKVQDLIQRIITEAIDDIWDSPKKFNDKMQVAIDELAFYLESMGIADDAYDSNIVPVR